MKNFTLFLCLMVLGTVFSFGSGNANATAISITNTSGAVDYVIGTPETIPFELTANKYNDNKLYVWDEVQNFTLTENLYVDRVADENAAYVGSDSNGFFIMAGTIVSSHYVQWDPLGGGVEATLNFDSDIFAFITADQKLFDSDEFLGLSGINYGDFTNRGLESGDLTNFNGGSVDIDWYATSPGDWTRLLTAYSPGANDTIPDTIPEPATMLLLGTGFIGLAGLSRKFKK